MLLALLLVLLGFLTFGVGSDVPGSPVQEGVTARLTVSVWPRGRDGSVSRWTLRCGSRPRGTHPAPGRACDALAANPAALAPLPPETACTEIYGGPQVAELRGSVGGRPIHQDYHRADGCGVDRWNALRPVFHIRV